jgi:hypothetical protein
MLLLSFDDELHSKLKQWIFPVLFRKFRELIAVGAHYFRNSQKG